MVQDIPTFDDVRQAAERIAGVARRTPLLEFENLNARAGGRVLIKPEMLQRTGSFKFRGAYQPHLATEPRHMPGRCRGVFVG